MTVGDLMRALGSMDPATPVRIRNIVPDDEGTGDGYFEARLEVRSLKFVEVPSVGVTMWDDADHAWPERARASEGPPVLHCVLSAVIE